MQPLSVLLLGNFWTLPGVRHVGQDLAERLAGRGHSVRCSSTHRNRLLRLKDILETAWRSRREYQVAQVDVFSGKAFLLAEAASEVLRLARKPYVLTLHGGALPQFARRHPRRVRRLLDGAAAVTAPSGFLAERLASFRSDIQVLPNALDISLYPCRVRNAPYPNLVWLRAFHRMYNPGLAVSVVSRLAERIAGVSLTMIGRDKDGSLEMTRALAHELGVAPHIQFAGALGKDEVRRRLDGADIFLNTTSVDNAPVSVLEAMACGLCVVSTPAGGMSYLAEDGVNALLVPEGDADAMAAAVARILGDRRLAASLSMAARRKAERCDWARLAPAWEELLGSVVS